jgi:ribosomal protein S18 acetylase RimI-like enzyme
VANLALVCPVTVGRVAGVLADGYTLHETAPPPEAAVELRARSGLSPKTLEQCTLAMKGSWCAVHVTHDATGEVVGMGRVIGDGGWYFHIADMATLPEHQRRGIGDAVLTRLVEIVRAAAPPDCYLTLMADPPGRRLYAKHGFVETAPASIGMVQRGADPAWP